MGSKLEALRRGDAVTLKDGTKARLNSEKKTIEMSNGRVVDVGNDQDYFPKSKTEERTSLQKQKIEQGISKSKLGQGPTEFIHQAAMKNSILRGGGDIIDRIKNTGEDYLAIKEAKRQVSERISEESPGMDFAAGATGLGLDVAATWGLPAKIAAPALTAIGSGSQIVDEPGKVIGETALAAGGGYLLDKGAAFLKASAARRGLSRQITKQAAEVEAKNVIMKDAHAAYSKALSTNSAETSALKKEFQTATASYKGALKGLPAEQKAAQQKFSEFVNKEIGNIEKSLPKGTTIQNKDLKVWDFYHKYIQENGLIGTKEAKNMEKVVRGLFHNEKTLNPAQFAGRLKSVEAAMVNGNNVERQLLSQFKEHLGNQTATIVEDSVISNEFKNGLFKTLKNDLSKSLSNVNTSAMGMKSSSEAIINSEKAVKEYLNSFSPTELAQKIKTPGFAQEIAEKAMLSPKISPNSLKVLKKQGLLGYVEESLKKESNQAITQLTKNIENKIANLELKGASKATKASEKVYEKFRKTYGMAEPVSPPASPSEPLYPTAPDPAQFGIQPPAEGVAPGSGYQGFSPEPVPTLPPAQGAAEGLGDFMEKPVSSFLKGKGPMGTGNWGKIAALQYLAKPKMIPAAAGYAGLKALTAPGNVGQAARATYKAAGLGAIEKWAERYPSYHNGILDDPLERRSLVKEIEDDESIPLEVQALTQSQINRGKSIGSKMQ